MITEEKILYAWKSSTKSYVFNIYYLTKQNDIQAISYSYIKGFVHEEIIKNMIEISKLTNFNKWLLPSSQEFKNRIKEL